MTYPYFAAALPAGEYGIRVIEDPDGTPTTLDVTVTIPSTSQWGGYYWHPLVGNPIIYPTIWSLLCTALTTASSHTYSLRTDGGFPVASDTRGLAVSLKNDNSDILEIVESNAAGAADGALPLAWLGYDPDGTLKSLTGAGLPTTIQPQYTWFPQCDWNPVLDTPDVAAIGQSPPTADGSFHSVDMTDGTIRRWTTFETIGMGFVGGRASEMAINPTFRSSLVDWGAQTGANTLSDGSYPGWVALDGTDGWWHRTRSGRVPFMYVSDTENPTTTIEGVFRINTSGNGPVSMSDWSGMRLLEKSTALARRQKLRFCAWRWA